jgi:hypothetical protein
MLEDLGVSIVDGRDAVTSLLQYPLEPVSVTPETVFEAYEISAAKNHDVYPESPRGSSTSS